MLELAGMLIDCCVKEVYLISTHGLFMGKSIPRIRQMSEIKGIVTTDTVDIPREKRLPNMHVLSVAPLFGEAIYRNYSHQSIGSLFEHWQD